MFVAFFSFDSISPISEAQITHHTLTCMRRLKVPAKKRKLFVIALNYDILNTLNFLPLTTVHRIDCSAILGGLCFPIRSSALSLDSECLWFCFGSVARKLIYTMIDLMKSFFLRLHGIPKLKTGLGFQMPRNWSAPNEHWKYDTFLWKTWFSILWRQSRCSITRRSCLFKDHIVI